MKPGSKSLTGLLAIPGIDAGPRRVEPGGVPGSDDPSGLARRAFIQKVAMAGFAVPAIVTAANAVGRDARYRPAATAVPAIATTGLSEPPAIAVASWGPGRLDIFGLGPGGAMFHKAWTGSAWYPSVSGWEDLGGTFQEGTAPAAVAWGPGRLDVFAVGIDLNMSHQAWTGSRWSGWQGLGGECASAPAVAAWGPGRLDAFVLGPGSAMYHKAWTGSQWYPSVSGWEEQGATFTTPPAVASWGANRLDIFGIIPGGNMLHRAWTGSQWYPSPGWEDLGGQFTDA
jgi:hypothetical protein